MVRQKRFNLIHFLPNVNLPTTLVSHDSFAEDSLTEDSFAKKINMVSDNVALDISMTQ